MKKARGLRGVSEHVSAALLALIVLVVGGYAVSQLLSQLQGQRQLLEEEKLRSLLEARQALSAALAKTDNSGNIHVVLVTGDFPVRVTSVYVDDKPASCSLRLTDGTSIGIPGTIPPYSAAILECSSTPGIHVVRVIYEGGELAVTAG